MSDEDTTSTHLSAEDLMSGRCQLCGTPRETTERTRGVWTTCDDCGQDWWCVATEVDWMDKPITWGCSGGCEDGWACECGFDDWDDGDPL